MKKLGSRSKMFYQCVAGQELQTEQKFRLPVNMIVSKHFTSVSLGRKCKWSKKAGSHACIKIKTYNK